MAPAPRVKPKEKTIHQGYFLLVVFLLIAGCLYSFQAAAKSHRPSQQSPISRLFAQADQVALVEIETMFHQDDPDANCGYQFTGQLIDPLKGTVKSKIRFRSSRPLMEGNQYYIFLGKSDISSDCKSGLSKSVMFGGHAAWPRISINIVTPFALKRSTIVIVDHLSGAIHKRLDFHPLPGDQDEENPENNTSISYWIHEQQLKQELSRLLQTGRL